MNKREAESRKKLMRQRVASFQKYVATYTDQAHYDEYSDRTYIDDMLYGMGLSMIPADYSGPGGYERFKEFLRRHLNASQTGGVSL